MNEMRPIQCHLFTCFVMTLVAGLALAPAFAFGHLGRVIVAAIFVFGVAVVCEGWIEYGNRQKHV